MSNAGENIDGISIENDGLLLVGLVWDYNRDNLVDLDISAFILGRDNTLIKDQDFVVYNHLNGRDGAVVHSGDNRVGTTGNDGNNEVIVINFAQLPEEIQKIAICVTMHASGKADCNFAQASNACVHFTKLSDEFDAEGEELVRVNLTDDFPAESGIVLAEFYRKGDNMWHCNAVGAGYQGGLAEIVRFFGGSV